jgi:phage shock protein PspC (stress-responsive transcriptional regulator)
MLAGVASGIAHYLNAAVTLARVSIAALALFTAAGVGPLHRRLGPDPADGED